MSKLAIDFNFLKELEGGLLLSGYIIDSGNEPTGVRIASGIELGSYTVEKLRALNINPILTGKLYPYIGKKGDEAKAYLKEFPLRLSENEAEILMKSAHQQKLEPLTRIYRKDSGNSLHHIPSAWQTVIASLELQYSGIHEKHPLFWRCVTEQSWDEALHLLRNFDDKFSTRRNTEADYIELHCSETSG